MKTTFNSGKAFSTPIRFFGCLFVVAGLLLLLESSGFSLVLTLLGLVVIFADTGIQFDTGNKRYREFTSYLGIKTEPWKLLDEFPYVSVLTSNQTLTFASRGNATWSAAEKHYDVFLLNKTHRKRVLVKRFSSIADAFEGGKQISELLGLTLTKFSPQISDKTKERRNRERRKN